jgi:hypothetical protein
MNEHEFRSMSVRVDLCVFVGKKHSLGASAYHVAPVCDWRCRRSQTGATFR